VQSEIGKMERDYHRGDQGIGLNERSALESAGASSLYQRDIEPQIDDISYMASRIRNTLTSRLSGAMKAKRVFDIIGASIALILLSPVFLIAAALIKLESHGAVFYTQERIGLNRRAGDRRTNFAPIDRDRRKRSDRRKNIHAGQPFHIYKFRTMVEDAEKCGPELASDNDPRITRMGRIFRKSRIDEIPQFINVLKGEMSIIGPRPERSFFINQMRNEVPAFPARLLVKPGITGLAQVENGYTQTLERMREKLFFDLKYISELSFLQEIKILFKTVYVVVTGKGAC
jgi:lipopolysaccharide/colanic/teichoic acid biosynthesis glycosyltransferase